MSKMIKKHKLTDKQFNISHFWANFQEWFGNPEVKPATKKLFTIKLPRAMTDKEILSELKPSEITLNELIGQLEIADKSLWYLAYIRDKNNILRAVYVDWSDDGWYVGAGSVGYPIEWGSGGQAFSRDPFDTNASDTMALSSSDTLARLTALESEMARIKKILNF